MAYQFVKSFKIKEQHIKVVFVIIRNYLDIVTKTKFVAKDEWFYFYTIFKQI